MFFFYEQPLLKFLFAFLDDWDNARDIAQDVFLAAYYALPQWTPLQGSATSDQENGHEVISSQHLNVKNHPLAPWLYQIATNKALTFLKKQAKRPDTQSLLDHTLAWTPSTYESTFEERYVVREQLREALKYLSEEDALCIVLRFALDEPYIEIAEYLHLSKEAVRKRVFRGLKILKSSYKAMEEGAEIK